MSMVSMAGSGVIATGIITMSMVSMAGPGVIATGIITMSMVSRAGSRVIFTISVIHVVLWYNLLFFVTYYTFLPQIDSFRFVSFVYPCIVRYYRVYSFYVIS